MTLQSFLQPDFAQQMVFASLIFLLPLRKRSRFPLRFLLLSLGTVLLITVGNYLIGMADPDTSEFLYSVSQNPETELPRLLDSGKLLPVSFWLCFHLGSPLLAAFLLFWFSADLSGSDALFGMSCAYLVQHIGFCVETGLLGEGAQSSPELLIHWLVYLAVAAVFHFICAKRFPLSEGRYQVPPVQAALSLFFTVMIAMVLNFTFRIVGASNPIVDIICRTYDVFSCICFLWLQIIQRRSLYRQAEHLAERRMYLQMKEQYDLSRENIEFINRKCHDLKHQITALRDMPDSAVRSAYIGEVAEAVGIYDAAQRTGNTALDTILTEKSLLCEKDRISWTCMADGAALAKMNAVDLYTLFGNALDNAIEASRRIADPELRAVSTTVRQKHGMAVIEIENCCAETPEFENGLPQTVKEDKANHGFGVRSIKNIVEKYQGAMFITAENGFYRLSVLLPL